MKDRARARIARFRAEFSWRRLLRRYLPYFCIFGVALYAVYIAGKDDEGICRGLIVYTGGVPERSYASYSEGNTTYAAYLRTYEATRDVADTLHDEAGCDVARFPARKPRK